MTIATPPKHSRPATFDRQVLSYEPFLHRMSARFAHESDREDLVQSTIEQALRLWASYNPAKNLGGWLVYQMRHIAFTERAKKRPLIADKDDPRLQQEPARQESIVYVASALRAIDASPHADVMLLVALGHTSEEIAAMRGVSRQRVHQKITAFRRAAVVAGRVA